MTGRGNRFGSENLVNENYRGISLGVNGGVFGSDGGRRRLLCNFPPDNQGKQKKKFEKCFHNVTDRAEAKVDDNLGFAFKKRGLKAVLVRS
jgi:hypothetical protein